MLGNPMKANNNLAKIITQLLDKEGSENPALETKLLFNHLLKDTHLQNKNAYNHLDKHIGQIREKIPVQRQIGYTEVLRLKIKITKNVLLPGPEIDILINACLNNTKRPSRIIDLCTGCGVVAIALGKKFKKSKILATDISNKALIIARENALSNNVSNINFLKGNMFKQLTNNELNSIDLLVSNPPYCKSKDISKLPQQIQSFTPKIAIDGGVDGLYFHRIIIKEAKNYLKSGGVLVLENETGQSDILKQILINSGYNVSKTYKNSKKEKRVIVAIKP